LVRLFSPSPSKRVLRKSVDLPAIKREYAYHGKPLTYFGLPSEGFYDVLDWLPYIGQVFAVERGDPYNHERKQATLLSKAIRLGLHERLVLLRGEVNQMIVRGEDDVGQELVYPFELVNFDYGGALLYPDRFRVEALEKFVRDQRGTDFLFLLTLNLREYDSVEITATQERIVSEVSQLSPRKTKSIEAYLEETNKGDYPTRQIIHVLYLLKGLAEASHYQFSWQPPVIYSGSKGTQLVHYMAAFRFQAKASTKVVSKQSLIDLLNASPRFLKGNRLVLMQRASPRF